MSEPVTEQIMADHTRCKHCGHVAGFHDDELGNCCALPGLYFVNQPDGCDCPGYEEGDLCTVSQ